LSGFSTLGTARLTAFERGVSNETAALTKTSLASSSPNLDVTEASSRKSLVSSWKWMRRSEGEKVVGSSAMPLRRSSSVREEAETEAGEALETSEATRGRVVATAVRAASLSLIDLPCWMYEMARAEKSAKGIDERCGREEREGKELTGNVLDILDLNTALHDRLNRKVGETSHRNDLRVRLPPDRELHTGLAEPRLGEVVEELEEDGEVLVGRSGVEDDERKGFVANGGEVAIEGVGRERFAVHERTGQRCRRAGRIGKEQREKKKNAPFNLQRSTLDSLNATNRLPELVSSADFCASNINPALALLLGRRRSLLLDFLLPLFPNSIHLLDRLISDAGSDRQPQRRKVQTVLELQSTSEGALQRGVRLVCERVTGEDRVLVGVGTFAGLTVESFAQGSEDWGGEDGFWSSAVFGEGVEEVEEDMGLLMVDRLAVEVEERVSNPLRVSPAS
jgi:hypothetical protein